MEKEDIDQRIKIALEELSLLNNKKASLEETEAVREYFKVCQRKTEIKDYYDFLSKIKVGKDGSYFYAEDHDLVKAYSNKHYKFSKIISLITTLKLQDEAYLEGLAGEITLRITNQELLDYARIAQEKLTDFRYIDGDRVIENAYGLKVFENPNNYTIADINKILETIDTEKLKRDYFLDGFTYTKENNGYLEYVGNKEGLPTVDLSKLIEREKQAFTNEEAKKTINTEEKTLKEFLDILELGEDKTIFSHKIDKTVTEYSMLDIIKHAFNLKYLSRINSKGISSFDERINLVISYDELIEYSKNAKRKLTQMIKFPDDKIEKYFKKFTVYKNPNNIIIDDIEEILKELSVEEFNEVRDTTNLEIAPSIEAISLTETVSDSKLIDYIHLSSREQEAFYGVEAQQALGLRILNKNNIKKLVKSQED